MVTNDDDEVDHYALRIPGLSAGEYTVIAYPCANTTAATTVTKCTAGNDPANGTFLGARARMSKVTVGPEKAGLPGVPTGVSAGTPGAGKVSVTWTHPRTESRRANGALLPRAADSGQRRPGVPEHDDAFAASDPLQGGLPNAGGRGGRDLRRRHPVAQRQWRQRVGPGRQRHGRRIARAKRPPHRRRPPLKRRWSLSVQLSEL